MLTFWGRACLPGRPLAKSWTLGQPLDKSGQVWPGLPKSGQLLDRLSRSDLYLFAKFWISSYLFFLFFSGPEPFFSPFLSLFPDVCPGRNRFRSRSFLAQTCLFLVFYNILHFFWPFLRIKTKTQKKNISTNDFYSRNEPVLIFTSNIFCFLV